MRAVQPYADPITKPVPVPDYLDLDGPVTDLRVGWNAGGAFGGVEPEVAEMIARAATLLAEAGCQVEEVSVPGLEARSSQAISLCLYSAEGGLYLEPIVAGRWDELSPNIKRRLSAPPPSLHDYLEAREGVEGLRQDIAGYFREYDLLLCPMVPIPAHPHGVTELVIAGQTVIPREIIRATVPWDLMGSPAISVPFAKSSEGLPIGIQIVGRHFEEASVLRAAAAFERVRGDIAMRPPV